MKPAMACQDEGSSWMAISPDLSLNDPERQGYSGGSLTNETAGAEVHVPFGGIKASGFGPHEQGRAALEFYTDLVTIYVDA